MGFALARFAASEESGMAHEIKESLRQSGLAVLLVCGTLAAFFPVVGNLFINYDDPGYITTNSHVLGGISLATIKWAFLSTAEGNWHPLTWISHALDCTLFGTDPSFHHAMNLFLHVLSSSLLFVILSRMTRARWQSAFVAFVFAIHPLHVESVAWAAERKDVLSGLFWILTIGAYARYRQSPGTGRYLVTLGSFCLGLTAKPMLVTLPFVLVLLDYWPLRKLDFNRRASMKTPGHASPSPRQIVIEKIPFLLCSVASSIVTYLIQQQQGAVAPADALTVTERIVNATLSYATYLRRTFLPTDLAVFYPHPSGALRPWEFGTATLVLVLVTLIAWKERARRPYFIVGWLWFLGTLVPVIGLVQVGLQAMADRYMYIPITGLSIMIAWGLPALGREWRFRRPLLAGGFTIAVILMGWATHVQAAYWRDNITLYGHALSVTSDNYFIQNNLGVALADSGRHREAVAHFREALRIPPDRVKVRANLARSLAALGERREALDHYKWIYARVRPDPRLHTNMGDALADEGRIDEAIAHFLAAVRLDSTDLMARGKLAELYARQSKLDEAKSQCISVLRMEPDNSRAHDVLGIVAGKLNQNDEALREFSEAIRCDSQNADALNDLGVLYGRLGKEAEAFEMYQRAVRADSGHWGAHFRLGIALAKRKRFDEAAVHWLLATRLNPAFSDAYLNLGRLSSMQGKGEEALRHYAEALTSDAANVQAHFECGNLLVSLGRLEEAETHFTAALRLAPTFGAARSALEEVHRLQHH